MKKTNIEEEKLVAVQKAIKEAFKHQEHDFTDFLEVKSSFEFYSCP